MCQPTQFSPRDELDLLPDIWQDYAPQASQHEKGVLRVAAHWAEPVRTIALAMVVIS